MFSTPLENLVLFSSNLKLSSANCFNLDQSKILSSGNGLMLDDYPNPFPNKPWMLRVYSTSLLKTLWEKEKMLVTSIFSFPHSVFYSMKKKIIILATFNLSSVNAFNSVMFKILLFGKERVKSTRQHKFSFVQTESICRHKNKCDPKTEICFQKSKKHTGKSRKCWL